MTDNKKLPISTLIGTSEEIFYQLGVLDKFSYQKSLEQVKTYISTPWKEVDKVIEKVLGFSTSHIFKNSKEFHRNLSSYAAGLNTTIDCILPGFIIPELMSCTSSWLPSTPLSIFGCSSFFLKDQETGFPIHGRILDFPLVGPFDKFERGQIFKTKNHPTIFSYASAGLPYPSITAMTSEGVTLAIHQKFSNIFNIKGTPIFELLYQLLLNCHDSKSAISFFKANQTITTWSVCMSFKNGDVLVLDQMGNDTIYEIKKLKSNTPIYYNNFLLDKSIHQEDFTPFGINNYCQMRLDIAKEKIKNLKKSLGYKSHELLLLKEMSTPIDQRKRDQNSWKLDVVTAASLQVTTLNPNSKKTLFITGDAPKIYKGEHIEIKNVFNKHSQKIVTDKTFSYDEKFNIGMKKLILSGNSFLAKDYQMAYHQIQMSIAHLKKYHEKNIAEFFFLVYQFILEDNNKVLTHLLGEFKNSHDKLPEYHQDHAKLFIFRLEKILKKSVSYGIDDIKNAKIKSIMKIERILPSFMFKKIISKMIKPCVDIIDIFYLHGK